MHTDTQQETKKFVADEDFLADIVAYSAMQKLKRNFPYGEIVDSYIEKINNFWKIIIIYKDFPKG